ncbi:DNA polymerase delta subunit 4 isoform X2 [Pseudoliparis swirei]|uniref:DNA polymerase delta subunit 4 isoform X2 n=1 Tax=Pseudoliparis swirei TaxID=2059687 RepID=UPI0024BEEBFA|nr:DNA polymerase delta subunit 4 isoform X2 [Pseudoliparis swirei]
MKDHTKEDTKSVTMTTKHGLITDTFKVVKRARNGVNQRKRPPTPLQKEPESEVAPEEELQRLRQFDLNWRFGPCTGISRQQRWERAKLHGLSPPEEVRDLLLQTQTDPKSNLSLWSEYPL